MCSSSIADVRGYHTFSIPGQIVNILGFEGQTVFHKYYILLYQYESYNQYANKWVFQYSSETSFTKYGGGSGHPLSVIYLLSFYGPDICQ